ncbi:MAG: hypothetical protein AAF609_14080 [Cyanobacteria bacterium P01_C01_bin.120]
MSANPLGSYTNPSSVLRAMKATLLAVQRVREILESEPHNLSDKACQQMQQHLLSIELGLKKEMGEIETQRYMQAPHLFDDDDAVEESAASLWEKLRTLVEKM